ncbi:hypothetical protein C0993_010367, partial [Termitomyces sp. T159_Od127]
MAKTIMMMMAVTAARAAGEMRVRGNLPCVRRFCTKKYRRTPVVFSDGRRGRTKCEDNEGKDDECRAEEQGERVSGVLGEAMAKSCTV